jgi:release factor glutamine methyltransferase
MIDENPKAVASPHPELSGDLLEVWTSSLALLTAGWTSLPDKPDETSDRTLRALWIMVAGDFRSFQATTGDLPPLSEAMVERLRDLVTQRTRGVPLAHLVGRQSFLGMDLLAGPEALIPRRETEILTEAAVERLRELAEVRGRVVALDLCTGSGNIALALAHRCERCRVLASDISASAIDLASRNALHLGLAERVRFLVGDLFEPFRAEGLESGVDLITCNPPYIPSSRVGVMPHEISGFEPAEAFDGGPMGLDLILRLGAQALDFLKPSSWLYFELGLGQGEFILRRLRKANLYGEVDAIHDGLGNIRGIMAKTAAAVP